MDRGWYVRFTVFLFAIVTAVGALWPSLGSWVSVPDWLVKDPAVEDDFGFFSRRISPGLDIKGGLRLMYEVKVEDAIRHRRDRLNTALMERLAEELQLDTKSEDDRASFAERVTSLNVGERRMELRFENPSDAEKLTRDLLRADYPELRIVERTNKAVRLALRDEDLDELRQAAVEQTVLVIQNRIDELQVREATVIGRDRDVIVEVPGATQEEFDRIEDLISRTARLEFKIVDDEQSGSVLRELGLSADGSWERTVQLGSSTEPRDVAVRFQIYTEQGAGTAQNVVDAPYVVARGAGARLALTEWIESVKSKLPDGREFAIARVDRREDPDSETSQATEESWRTYYLHRTAGVTGNEVDDAFVTFDQGEGGGAGRPVVAVHFGGSGATQFQQLTGAHIQERMAIVLDGVVESAPTIQAEIAGGRSQITMGSYGSHSEIMEAANELVVVLRAGALPAPIERANRQEIGPTLGADSVERGVQGALVGIVLVLFFMAVYYQVAGLVADLMVVLNVLFLLAALSALGATLTLPGVAGIALTVGMAVDANVLITERIREELRLGKSARSAIDQGFRRAFWSVMDAQLTTFIAGVVLFQFGTGPIKGFAVTLMIGIVTSLFTGIFCSKVVLDWVVRGLRVPRLRVG